MAEQRVIYIVIDPSKARSGASSVVNSLRGIEGSTDRVNNRLRATDRAVQNISRSFNRLQAIFIGMQGFRLFSGFLNQLIDADKVVTTFKSQMYTVTGDLNDAADAFEHLKDTAQAYAVPLNSITKGYAKLRASMDFDHLRKYNEALFQSTVILSSVLHLPEYNTERVFNVMIQIMSKGQLMMEELKQQLGEHVPGAITLAAEAMGYTVEEMMDKMQKGLISAEEFAAGWSKFIIDRFGPAVEIATKSIQAGVNRFQNVIQESMIEMSQSESGFAISKLILTIVSKIDSASEHFKVFGTQVAGVALDINDFVESLTPGDIDRFFKSIIDLVNAFISFLTFIGRAILFLIEYKEEVKLTAGVVFGSIVAVKAHNAALAIWAASVANASGAVAMLGSTLASLLTVLSLAGAAFVGWSIGSWLYNEYDIVKKAGNRIALAIHLTVESVANAFEMMGTKIKAAVTEPFDYAMGKIAKFLRFLNSLGQGVLDFVGIDYDASGNLLSSLADYLDSGDAGDITRKLAELRQSHKDEIAGIKKIYDDLYDAIGKGGGSPESINDRLEIDEDLLAKYQEMRDYLQKLATDTGEFTTGVDDQAKALDDLRESIEDIRNELDPLGKEFEDFYEKKQLLHKATALKIIDAQERDKLIKGLVEAMADAGEDSAEAFTDEFENYWADIAPRLIDHLYEANWDAVGRMIGGELVAGLTEDLGRSLTKNFGEAFEEMQKGGGGLDFGAALGGLGSALTSLAASPMFGPIAGVIGRGIADKLSDYFSDDWDPTEDRQSSQGTGTVLGSINAKSESIAKATDLAATASRELVGINRNMLRALQAVQLGVEGASSRVARGYTGAQGGIGMPDVYSGGQALSLGLGGGFEFAADMYLDYLSFIFTGGLVDFGKLLGGKAKKRDEGIQIIGGYISDLIDNTIVNAYATFRVKKHALDDYDTKEKFQRIGGDVERQFALVFESLYDSVVAGADVLGVDAASRLASFKVGTQKLSLEGLNAEQQQKELEAYFGTVFDNMVQHAIPWLEDFQKAGEGLGETLARIATDVAVTEQAIDMLGLRFSSLSGRTLVEASQRLVEVNGGMEQFISGMQNFISNFATEAQQFEINANALASGLGDLPLPETREGFWALMQAQDASTAQGAENIATLLRLQGTANDYYSALEKGAEEASAAVADLAQSLRNLTDSAFRDLQKSVAKERALAQEEYDARITANQIALDATRSGLQAIEEELRGIQSARSSLSGQFDPIRETLRQNALSTLRGALASGDLTGVGVAADAAAQIEEANFQSRTDYLREQGRTINLLAQLDESGSDQLTTAERSVIALERQTRTIERQYADEMERLDGILENAQDQIDALRGINTGVMSIADAINELAFALSMERPSAIRQEYTEAGRTADAQGSAWWDAEIAAGRATIADLEYQLWLQSEGAREFAQWRGVPGFANGGMHAGGLRMVGERGPELEMTGASRIMSNNDLSKALGGGKEMLAEIAQLRRENGDLMKQLLTKTAAIEDYTRTLRNLKREKVSA